MKEEGRAEKLRSLKRGYLFLLLRLALLAAGLYLLFGVVCLLWRVQGREMLPAVHDGDLLLAYRLERVLNRGDLVIYQADGQRRVGRIAANGNDRVEITANGSLLVNGALQSRDSAFETRAEEEALSLTVPEGCLYILGDAGGAGYDSRGFGPVPTENVEGKVIGLLRVRGF